MDMLFSRYACPFILFDEMIECGRTCEFVDTMSRITKEEKDEKTLWEYFLHKVYGKSFEAFKNEIKPNILPQKIDFGTTIQKSRDILNGFEP